MTQYFRLKATTLFSFLFHHSSSRIVSFQASLHYGDLHRQFDRMPSAEGRSSAGWANNAYNWNPATPAVTVVIGVITLWFALLPIAQGLLFPPERLKYDKPAVERWSEPVRKKFDLSNMNYATTRTPALDIEPIADYLKLPETGPVEGLAELRWTYVLAVGARTKEHEDEESEKPKNVNKTSIIPEKATSPQEGGDVVG
jgi:hypothetical protein